MSFQSPLPLQKSEPVIIYDSINTKPLTVTPKSGYCTDKPATLSPKMWAKYKYFGVSIHNDNFQLQLDFEHKFTLRFILFTENIAKGYTSILVNWQKRQDNIRGYSYIHRFLYT